MKKEFKPTYLYIKQHNKTGLKYFGKTTRADPEEYTGSGTVWLRHLKKHGDNVTTTILGYYIDRNKLIEDALTFSKEHDIVNSNEWANLQLENGVCGGDTSSNFTEESRKKISDANKGVKNKRAKLNKNQVLEIYFSSESPEILSSSYKVGTGQIFGIKRKIYYKDITESIKELPGVYKGKKKIRYPLQEEHIIDIFLKEETYRYFKEKYNASRLVVKNIKTGRSYSKITENLGSPGCVKKYNLTNQDTVDIFKSKESIDDLAKKYKIHKETVRNIKSGRSRKFFKDDY